jgi:diguanylate cyclase (GGDEF)-like protein
MLQSGRHSSEFYVEMWATLLSQDHWSGEVWNRRKNGDVYPEMLTISAVKNAAGLVQHYVSLCTDITTMKVYQEQLEHVAHYDVLTDLPNRVLLADRLSHAIALCQRREQSLGVAFMDLDGFKEVNDNYGHNVGDELLITVSQRMKAALREGDTLARIGGDEFIAVMVDLDSIEEITPILERLLQAASDPVTIGNDVMQVSASIGVTLYPQDGSDADQLIRHADQAMYGAKQTGKNRYRLFDTALANASKVQLESISDIRSALYSREFVLYYQPKVNMRTGAVIGVEALIRWQHPERGLVPPLEFLPVIEGQAISLDLGEWVISSSLSQISQWQSIGINLPISVNISGYQLQQGNFAIRVAALLAAHPEVNPNCLELEILETSALHDISKVSATMNACHKLGVRFALDDFGTGYSSLTHLRRLPAQLIKIDQSFVSDMLEDTDDCAIVEGVIGLARAFRRDVIAEGVESIAHGLALLQLGCELAQGYGIARPMPGADIPQWVSHWKADNSCQAWGLIEVNQLVTTEINRM